jgi:hypothetical protein
VVEVVSTVQNGNGDTPSTGVPPLPKCNLSRC